jgi:hypothetical protein
MVKRLTYSTREANSDDDWEEESRSAKYWHHKQKKRRKSEWDQMLDSLLHPHDKQSRARVERELSEFVPRVGDIMIQRENDQARQLMEADQQHMRDRQREEQLWYWRESDQYHKIMEQERKQRLREQRKRRREEKKNRSQIISIPDLPPLFQQPQPVIPVQPEKSMFGDEYLEQINIPSQNPHNSSSKLRFLKRNLPKKSRKK